MRNYVCTFLIMMLGLSASPLVAQSSPQSHEPQRQSDLKEILTITWKKGRNLPQGFQDSGVGIVAGTLVTVGGFASGQKGVPGKPDRYPRGFLKRAWGLDLARPDAGWVVLPDFPGAQRQGLACTSVNDRLYCWGGFSYSAPFTYKDGYVLSKQRERWTWEPLPELPSPVSGSGSVAIGSKIYLFGGADYDSEKFYTHGDRSGGEKRLGARLLTIDTQDLKSGWKRLAQCPGTPRWVAAVATVKGRLFVIGGGTGNDNPRQPGEYSTVVDNWSYDPGTDRWDRLRDLPVASGNFPSGQIVYKERYIILVGGYQYKKVENPDASLRETYGVAHRHYADKEYYSDVFVYDTQTGLFGTATLLPLNNNMPAAAVRGPRIYLVGGETGGAVIEGEHFGHHPDLLLIGEITLGGR